MSEGPSDRVQALFDQAVELAPEQRAGFLNAACSQDPTLRAEVEELLAYEVGPSLDTKAAGRLKSPVVRKPGVQAADTPHADDLGAMPCRGTTGEGQTVPLPPRYQVRDEVGRGGMGQVLRGGPAGRTRPTSG